MILFFLIGYEGKINFFFWQVRSLTLDVKVWDSAVLSMLQSLGNLFANSVWEELLQSSGSSQIDENPDGWVLLRLMGLTV